MSVNKVLLIGLVGKDPEIRSMGNGSEVASFSLATSEHWKDKTSGEKVEKTEWHSIVIFGNIVSVVKNYVKKGSKLYLEGTLQTRKWVDKQGIERYKTEVVLQGYNAVLQLLDSKQSIDNAESKEEVKSENKELNGEEYDRDDDIPF